jgi:hypothetical protein
VACCSVRGKRSRRSGRYRHTFSRRGRLLHLQLLAAILVLAEGATLTYSAALGSNPTCVLVVATAYGGQTASVTQTVSVGATSLTQLLRLFIKLYRNADRYDDPIGGFVSRENTSCLSANKFGVKHGDPFNKLVES